MLESFGASKAFNKTVCGKRCFNALVKVAAKAQAPPIQLKNVFFGITMDLRMTQYSGQLQIDLQLLVVGSQTKTISAKLSSEFVQSTINLSTQCVTGQSACVRAKPKEPDEQQKQPASVPLSIIGIQTKKSRKDDLASQPAFLRLKSEQLAQHRELQNMELDIRNKEFSLKERDLYSRERQLENDERVAIARSQCPGQ
ncbi:hypothetical protein PHMEG_00016763 [Phytophthora megakarya]|uniref:Uncharacterized protein n=1 Tax=Phytophthora megakarya TaxID=4795 RepID=A0A225VY50_9STRA|nr:hypothetical protein PHMEG_00016763 [Phytophthora megakarya]